MFNISRWHQTFCPAFALAALLPSAVQAQATKQLTSYADTHKSVIITVDYVEVSQTKLMQASQWIAFGPQHDTQLLAALVKNGAADTHGLSVFCHDGGTMERGGAVTPSSGTIRRMIRRMPFQYQDSEYLDSTTKATAKFSADGTVTVLMAASLASPFPAEAPIFSAEASLTFRNGQTLEIGRTFVSSAEGRSARLVFARITVGGDPLPPLPDAPRRSTVPLFPAPISVDPGMVIAAPHENDPRMVIGRGIDPKRIDPMNTNTLPVPPPAAPKRK